MAIAVYGQDNYTSSSAGTGTDGLSSPHAVALDSGGNLYVADTGNNRVLYFPSGQTTATDVYGQNASLTDATANNGGLSASSLSAPAGVALDLNDNLYIADAGNNRILYYPSGQATATRVYGQGGDFTGNMANNNGIGSASLSAPAGVALDASGNIYSADTLNNRVLQYQDKLHVTSQPAATITVDNSFSTAFSLTDVGSGLAFADFAGSVSPLIKSGSGAQGATLGGTTTVTGASGVATFSNLSICAPAASCTSAINTITYPRTVPADSTAPTPVKFFNAASGSGQGHFQFTITLATTVPATSYKGTYTSTITPAINDGA